MIVLEIEDKPARRQPVGERPFRRDIGRRAEAREDREVAGG